MRKRDPRQYSAGIAETVSTRTSFSGSVRESVVFTGKLVLAVVFLGYLFDRISFGGIAAALEGLSIPPLISAGLLLIPNLWLQHLKWKRLVTRFIPDAGNTELFGSLLSGFTFGLLTPARIGEFAGRGVFLPRLDKPVLLSLTIVDKFLSFVVTVVAGLVSVLLYSRFAPVSPIAIPIILGVCIACLAAAAGGFVAASPRLLPLGIRARFRRFVPGTVRKAFDALARISTKDIVVVSLLSLLFYITFVAQFVLLLQGFHEMDFSVACAAVGCIMLAKTVVPPITMGELGIRESASIMILGLLGYPPAGALNASLLLFALNVLLPSAAGAVGILLRRARGTVR